MHMLCCHPRHTAASLPSPLCCSKSWLFPNLKLGILEKRISGSGSISFCYSCGFFLKITFISKGDFVTLFANYTKFNRTVGQGIRELQKSFWKMKFCAFLKPTYIRRSLTFLWKICVIQIHKFKNVCIKKNLSFHLIFHECLEASLSGRNWISASFENLASLKVISGRTFISYE